MNKKEALEYILANIEGPDYVKYEHSNMLYFDGVAPKQTIEKIISDAERRLEKYKKYKHNLDIIKNALESGNYDVDSSVIDFALEYIDISKIPVLAGPKYISYGSESLDVRLKNAEIMVEHLKKLSDFTTKLPELFKKD